MVKRSLVVLMVLSTACATSSADQKKDRSDTVASGDAASPLEGLERDMDAEYARSGQVLVLLDKGASLHFASQYSESNATLSQAEARMKEVIPRTKVAGAPAGSTPASLEYSGPAYERLLIHLLRAVNDLFLSQPEVAVVEARKAGTYLKALQGGTAAMPMQGELLVAVLQQLVNEDAGLTADAAAAAKQARSVAAKDPAKAQQVDPKAFATPMKKGEGEIVLIHYNGPAPRVEAQARQASWAEAVAAVQAVGGEPVWAQVAAASAAGRRTDTISYARPTFAQDPHRIVASRLVVKGKESPVQLAMDMSSLAKALLEDPSGSLRQRALARATVRYLNGGDAGAGETDTRAWNTIASQIRIGHAHVPAGKQQIEVVHMDSAGRVVSKETLKDVVVKAGKRTYLQVRTVL